MSPQPRTQVIDKVRPSDCRCEVRNRGCLDEHGVTDDCPLHGLTDEEQARYYEAIDCGATHDDAMEAAGGY